MKEKRSLLAVLGRGCMMEYPGGPWKPTRDFDVWDIAPGGKGRPAVLANKNDDDPNSVIGGGELNLSAAVVLHRELRPALTVFAYGDNSPSLAQQGFPSESSVMTDLFEETITEITGAAPRVEFFNPLFWKTEGKASGTFNEVRNIFKLAKREGSDEIIIVTILVHMNRVLAMMEKHLQDPEFAELRAKVRFEVSESVLLRESPEFAERIWTIFGSQSFLRNLQREANGLAALRKGVTQTNQPGVVMAGAK